MRKEIAIILMLTVFLSSVAFAVASGDAVEDGRTAPEPGPKDELKSNSAALVGNPEPNAFQPTQNTDGGNGGGGNKKKIPPVVSNNAIPLTWVCKGDFNRDEQITNKDVQILVLIYGMKKAEDNEWFWNKLARIGDFDDNEMIDISDLAALLSKIGTQCESSPGVNGADNLKIGP